MKLQFWSKNNTKNTRRGAHKFHPKKHMWWFCWYHHSREHEEQAQHHRVEPLWTEPKWATRCCGSPSSCPPPRCGHRHCRVRHLRRWQMAAFSCFNTLTLLSFYCRWWSRFVSSSSSSMMFWVMNGIKVWRLEESLVLVFGSVWFWFWFWFWSSCVSECKWKK